MHAHTSLLAHTHTDMHTHTITLTHNHTHTEEVLPDDLRPQIVEHMITVHQSVRTFSTKFQVRVTSSCVFVYVPLFPAPAVSHLQFYQLPCLVIPLFARAYLAHISHCAHPFHTHLHRRSCVATTT